MKLNIKKTKVMSCSKTDLRHLSKIVGGQPIEEV